MRKIIAFAAATLLAAGLAVGLILAYAGAAGAHPAQAVNSSYIGWGARVPGEPANVHYPTSVCNPSSWETINGVLVRDVGC